MMIIWLKIKEKLKNFDIFDLGNSYALVYFLLFLTLPILIFFKYPFFRFSNSVSKIHLTFGYFLYLVTAIGAFIIGYKMKLGAILSKKIPNILKKEWDFKKAFWIFGIVLFLSVIIKIIMVLGGAYHFLRQADFERGIGFFSGGYGKYLGILTFLSNLSLMVLAIAAIGYFSLKKIGDRQYKIWGWLLAGSFLIEFAYAFPQCTKEGILYPIIIYLIIKNYLQKTNYFQIFLIVSGIFIILFPGSAFCRNNGVINVFTGYKIQNENRFVDEKIFYENKTLTPQITTTTIAIVHRNSTSTSTPSAFNIFLYIFGKMRIKDFIVESAATRLDQSRIPLAIFEKTDHYLYGETFSSFFIMLVPRVIWPNKPSIDFDGIKLAQNLNFSAPNDNKTSIYPTVVGEWYMNFGIWGLVFGMFLLGILYRFLFNYLIIDSGRSSGGVMIYSLFWLNIVRGMEFLMIMLYLNLIKLFILMFVINYFLAKKTKLS